MLPLAMLIAVGWCWCHCY